MASGFNNKYIAATHKKRPGQHAKTKSSFNKNSTNYKKKYVGQGR